MRKFPNKMIKEAYETAKDKVFTQSTANLHFRDENGCSHYNHNALQWLYSHGIMIRTFNEEHFVFEYRIVK